MFKYYQKHKKHYFLIVFSFLLPLLLFFLPVLLLFQHMMYYCLKMNSVVVGIATGYWLDDRGFGVPSSGRDKNFLFSTSSRPALESTQPPIQWVPGALSPGVKRPGHEADHSPPTSAEVKKMCLISQAQGQRLVVNRILKIGHVCTAKLKHLRFIPDQHKYEL
jgi:hypothetical protein